MVINTLRIAVIGQSAFSAEFLTRLINEGYTIAGVFTIPDDERTGREDILATTAKQHKLKVFKFKRWQIKKQALPEVVEQYMSVGANLNVLPYCNQFIPTEVIEAPEFKSINYHPSLLPRHRGGASINWTLIMGDEEAGFTIFWTDDGLDTGPILLKRSCYITVNDTVETLYTRFLYPAGIDGLVEAVGLISTNQAPRIPQSEALASYEPILRNKDEICQLKFEDSSAQKMHNFIRGMDKVPGAWINISLPGENLEKVRLFGSTIYRLENGLPRVVRLVNVEGMSKQGIVHEDGILLFANADERPINISKVQFAATGKMISASSYGSPEAKRPPLVLTEDETRLQESVRAIWASILSTDVTSSTDFFFTGASSMDVTRLVEEVKDLMGDDAELGTEDVYMATQFEDFVELIVRKMRGEGSSSGKLPDNYQPVLVHVNKMDVSFPNQIFINNNFVNSSRENHTLDIINPTTEETICKVQLTTREDVDKAVKAAQRAFRPDSRWRLMNARDRGKLLYKLADLMEQYKQELATIESLDSGAVYTLAIKTHIGMSIDVFRYFAGWCDKIEGSVIPINHARPQRNLAITKKEPIGVCGIITPWNYPLMMVSWKAAACLAAGNTLVLKPAQACPLTALKWAELIVRAGFPPGVVNIVPGTGGECGQALCDHPGIRKLGFTGSTPTGKHIMESCAISNVKRCSLELGGKSPLIIFSDCDFDKAIRYGMSGVFFNKGENCIAAGRIFVEDKIHDKFIAKVVENVSKMKIDDPFKRSTDHGPQNHLKHLEHLIDFCNKGVAEGAKLVYGGRRVDRAGYFFMPTIFTDVTDNMFIAKEESFGPIMIVSKFGYGDIDGVIERANSTDYGLASGVITSDRSKAQRVADGLDAGTCFINTYNKTDVAAPFGGFKQSGFGKDLGAEALQDYLRTKSIIEEY